MLWNRTFKAFAEYWSFEPRVCQAYRAQTKGKVESGVKYFRRNFLPGRAFVDDVDFDEQLAQWMHDIADVRIHGTTHERPIDRFRQERDRLIPTASQPGFRVDARHPRLHRPQATLWRRTQGRSADHMLAPCADDPGIDRSRRGQCQL